jgi:hypothetical protein
MTKQVRQWSVFLILIGIAASVILSCRVNDDRIELEKDSVWQYYSVDPDTILESLTQGNTDVFTPLAATPEGELPVPQRLVYWSEEDFFLVAKTIHEQSWGESLGDQNLYRILFRTDCAIAERGIFSEAEIDSFKIIQTEGEEETRIEHWINIMPSIDLVYTVEVAYQPNVNYKELIELSLYQVTASEALQIAENSGGSTIRAEVGNDCEISVLTPGSGDRGWRILYQNKTDRYYLLFEIAIDPETGDYKVIYPDQK